ncbi:MAG: hypothetical protein P0111_10390 [Nitrospira sp.]|nr:hypothetical protein [Nitrospira sp.]
MKKAATFASNPPGFASYPFEEKCPVILRTGQYHNGVIHLSFEGRWNPSETRQDRPNAVETLFIENYEQFFPNRQMKGSGERRIFVFWTARCTADPWLKGGTCRRLGEYVPDDVREAFPSEIDDKPFPLTKDSLSPTLKQQLIKQYQEANQQGSARMSNQQRIRSMMTQPQQAPIVKQSPSTQAMVVQPQQSPVITPSQAAQAQAAQGMEAEPQAAFPTLGASMGAQARSGLFARGVEEKEGQTSGKEGKDPPAEGVESTDPGVIEEGTPEVAEPVALTLEQPFHATDAKGEAVEFKAGAYEIGTILDLQLGVAQEGRRTVLLNANRDTHQIPISRTIAVVIPGPLDDLHLLFLTADGRRFETIGFPSGVRPRSMNTIPAIPDKTIEAAVLAASVGARTVSSPPCRPNPSDIGPRWVPVPCTLTSP